MPPYSGPVMVPEAQINNSPSESPKKFQAKPSAIYFFVKDTPDWQQLPPTQPKVHKQVKARVLARLRHMRSLRARSISQATPDILLPASQIPMTPLSSQPSSTLFYYSHPLNHRNARNEALPVTAEPNSRLPRARRHLLQMQIARLRNKLGATSPVDEMTHNGACLTT